MRDEGRTDPRLAYEQFHRSRPNRQPSTPAPRQPRADGPEKPFTFETDRFVRRFEKHEPLW